MYGSTLEAALIRQKDPTQADVEDVMESIASNSVSATLITFMCILPGILLASGSLLAIWLLITSLQIVAHMPLLHSLMPLELVTFFKNFLQPLRLMPAIGAEA